jgi:hypothetical protein
MPKNNLKLRLKLPPQPLEPRRIGGGVFDGVSDGAMPQVILNQPRIRALVGGGGSSRLILQHKGRYVVVSARPW